MKKSLVLVSLALVGCLGLVGCKDKASDSASSGQPAAGYSLPAAPPPPADAFKDTSPLKPPAGVKVAIYEFDDLECPACAHALPILHAAQTKYDIALVHHDYPLTEIHVWSFDAAVTARYLQDRVSAEAGDEFRKDVFAHQTEISSKDDLSRFTKAWFAAHGYKMPFAMDPKGVFAGEVKADRALGERIGVKGTPTIFVVTPLHWVHVRDLNKLGATIEAAQLEGK